MCGMWSCFSLLSLLLIAVAAGSPVSAPDPRLDGWQTEAIAESLAPELKQLAAALESGKAAPREVRYSIPDKSGAAVSRGGFVITRWEGARDCGSGPPGLAAVRAWLGLTPKSDDIHVKWKTVRVAGGTGGTETDHIFHLHAAGSMEWNGEARLTWSGDPPELRSVAITPVEKTVRSAAGLHFTDATAAVTAGCDSFAAQYLRGNTHWRQRLEIKMNYLKFGQTGFAIGDVNGDRLEDLYSCQGGGLPNRLFLHQPDGTIRDATKDSGLDILDCSQTALLADFDNDGDADAVVATIGPLCFFENDGGGRFTRRLTLTNVETGFGLAAADWDLDGDLDLYVCRYFASAADGGALAKPLPPFDANNGGPNFLLRNDGRGGDWLTFTDATAATGLDENNHRYSYAAVWDDLNGDGRPDLYVANDFGRNNLYLQQAGPDGSFRFRDTALDAGLGGGAFGMSASTGDFNRDGIPDIHLGAMWSSAGHRVTRADPFRKGDTAEHRERYFQLARGNSLFAGTGGGKFNDISDSAGIRLGRWSWSCLFADANNDGWEDILVANGFMTGEIPDDL